MEDVQIKNAEMISGKETEGMVTETVTEMETEMETETEMEMEMEMETEMEMEMEMETVKGMEMVTEMEIVQINFGIFLKIPEITTATPTMEMVTQMDIQIITITNLIKTTIDQEKMVGILMEEIVETVGMEQKETEETCQ